MCCNNNMVVSIAEASFARVMNFQALEKWSTVTVITMLSWEAGNLVIKSMEIPAHSQEGRGHFLWKKEDELNLHKFNTS
ncbi:hypothetical protein AOLI_G00004240 [Acnodon oligacanthus]